MVQTEERTISFLLDDGRRAGGDVSKLVVAQLFKSVVHSLGYIET